MMVQPLFKRNFFPLFFHSFNKCTKHWNIFKLICWNVSVKRWFKCISSILKIMVGMSVGDDYNQQCWMEKFPSPYRIRSVRIQRRQSLNHDTMLSLFSWFLLSFLKLISFSSSFGVQLFSLFFIEWWESEKSISLL